MESTPGFRAIPQKILIVEDEPDVIDLLKLNLCRQGRFAVLTATDGATGLQKAREELPDLIVLDLMLPRLSGLEICKILKTDSRTTRILIVILTARVETVDRIAGLEFGADDYITKPFSPREIVLRVTALLGKAVPHNWNRERLTVGPITLDQSQHFVEVGGKKVVLASAEFRLLSRLMERPGHVQTRERLLNEVWGYENAMITRTVDTHVGRLRKKLGQAADVIETVRTYGYRLRHDPLDRGRSFTSRGSDS